MAIRMFLLLACILPAACVLHNSILAEIKSCDSMADVVASLDEGTMFVLDLDNTVMEPAEALGSDQWYEFVVQQYVKHGLSADAALDRADLLWGKVQAMAKIIPVERMTPELIAKEQRKGTKVMALTARAPELAETTLSQLSSIGVDFSLQPPLQQAESLVVDADHSALYQNGVLFVGPKNNKGKVLATFLQGLKAKPRRVVFVDDKLKHVQDMDEAMARLHIPYLGFRYGRADKDVEVFHAHQNSLDLGAYDPMLHD